MSIKKDLELLAKHSWEVKLTITDRSSWSADRTVEYEIRLGNQVYRAPTLRAAIDQALDARRKELRDEHAHNIQRQTELQKALDEFALREYE